MGIKIQKNATVYETARKTVSKELGKAVFQMPALLTAKYSSMYIELGGCLTKTGKRK